MSDYKAPKAHPDLDVHYVRGSLQQIVMNIAEGNTGGLPPQEYAQQNLERLADPSQHLRSMGGTQ